MRRNLLIAGAALTLLAPAPALAARAQVVRTETGQERSRQAFSTIHFDAAAGERNALTLSRDSGGIVLRDDGATIEPGARCTAIDEHAVRCVHSDEQSINGIAELVELRLGDESDSLAGPARAPLVRADGGDGDDVLQGAGQMSGGAGDDVLQGGPGGDALDGGPGRDKLYGGEGGDSLIGGDPDDAPAPDVLDGGAGLDVVSYVGRTAPVTVDLANPSTAGAPGEGDTLAGIEHLRGGAGADVLRGDDGPNSIAGGGVTDPVGDTIEGRGGADRLDGTVGDDDIDGGAGDDEIGGVSGADRLSGGAGDDTIDVMLDDRGADRIECGTGKDVVNDPIATHLIPADCETIWLGPATISPVRDERPGGQSFRIGAFPRGYIYAPCARLRLGDPPGSLGSRLFTMPKRGTKYVRVPLTARGRRKVRPGARVLVRFTFYYDCDRSRPAEPGAPGAYTFLR